MTASALLLAVAECHVASQHPEEQLAEQDLMRISKKVLRIGKPGMGDNSFVWLDSGRLLYARRAKRPPFAKQPPQSRVFLYSLASKKSKRLSALSSLCTQHSCNLQNAEISPDRKRLMLWNDSYFYSVPISVTEGTRFFRNPLSDFFWMQDSQQWAEWWDDGEEKAFIRIRGKDKQKIIRLFSFPFSREKMQIDMTLHTIIDPQNTIWTVCVPYQDTSVLTLVQLPMTAGKEAKSHVITLPDAYLAWDGRISPRGKYVAIRGVKKDRASKPIDVAIFLYNLQTRKLEWVGRIFDKDKYGEYGSFHLRWTNDDNHLSYVYKDNLYVVSVQ